MVCGPCIAGAVVQLPPPLYGGDESCNLSAPMRIWGSMARPPGGGPLTFPSSGSSRGWISSTLRQPWPWAGDPCDAALPSTAGPVPVPAAELPQHSAWWRYCVRACRCSIYRCKAWCC